MPKSDALREEIAERLNLPAGAAGVVKVTLLGARRALVEEHRGLLGYSRERIEIDGGAHRVCIDGEGLELEAMLKGTALETQTRITEGMTKEEQEEFDRLLEIALQHMAAGRWKRA